tara:strand:+ start:51 stop:671 length:621 start_codon:yes stop_codon:yes gene_type:complete
MAVAPITQPTAAGIDPVDYSPWAQAAQARSALPGILNYVPNANPLAAPTATPTFQGGTQYGNYVRNYPDLMAAFQNPNQTGSQNIQDWGKWHWLTHGQHNPSRILPSKPTDSPISLGDTMDTGGARVSVGTSGLPMPDVEGYKYVYNAYQWNQDNQAYEPIAAKYHDIDEYPYYPYMPLGGEAPNRNGRILVGTSLVPDDYHTYPD